MDTTAASSVGPRGEGKLRAHPSSFAGMFPCVMNLEKGAKQASRVLTPLAP